ncbi:HAD family hydrolase [Chlorobaculum sp. 24CR]|uniref:HAD family hydrolase n=1 Tax=Chlorobaculum sp. 24CR TaxID=2508878 RepID=UPI00100C269E|nr:HAD family hydrolase [Chlorobaculum sp. 24CR]RXK88398.1 HAD family hydrolase [Chlorobaculum sp. 24CR]
MKYQLIVFDFDGTLADSELSIMEAMRLVARDFGLPEIDCSVVRRGIGLPLQRTIELGLGLDAGDAEAAVERYRNYYHEIAFDSTRLFPGVSETLELLRREHLLAIASSKSRQGLLSMTRHLGILDHFSCIAGAQDVAQGKPAPDMVLLALERLAVPAEQCLVVGDTVFDIEMGQRARADTCAVTYGNHSAAELRGANPTFIIDSFSGITGCL